MRPKRCHHCLGKFGLVRHYHNGKHFCSNTQGKRCKQRHIEEQAQIIRVHKFLAYLRS